jgi:hypothetical protein
MLAYNFERIYHAPVESYFNVINVEPPYAVLFELDLLNTSAAANSFAQIVQDCINNGSTSAEGFEQMSLLIGAQTTTLEYTGDSIDDIITAELPTIELLKLLHDWRDFLMEQEKANPE